MKIALSGKQRAGKDLCADYLVKKYDFKKVGFADSLKELAKSYFGFTDDEINEKDWKVRAALQMLGKVGRLKDINFWVKKLVDSIDNEENVVIKDVRYLNEADFVRENGFVLIRIESDRDVRERRGLLYGEDDLSETDLDNYDFDYVIYNNGTKSMFYKQIDQVIKNILNKSEGD